MPSKRPFRYLGRRALFACVLLFGLALSLPAFARAESCAFDPAQRSVTASITPGGTTVLDVVGGQIRFGAVPSPCGGATTTNTDSISIAGNAGTVERLTLDQRTGLLGPGATGESNIPEIEITTTLGDATDTVVLYLTSGADHVAPGQNGLALNADGDVDVTFAPGAFFMEIYALEGDDYVNGRGEGGAGLHFLGPLTIDGGPGNESLVRGSSEPDVLRGGPGNDRVDAQESADLVDGGAGNDVISSGAGNDQLTGGPGSDSFAASSGDDVIYAEDDESDSSINGGPGNDTAYYDAGLDANPTAVETAIPDPPPPPPPPPPAGTCAYDAASRVVSVQVAAGTAPTLRVSGGEIWFGVTPAACGGATTANTDRIDVVGPAASTEALTIDQSSGAFAPGFAVESGSSEIEITVSLGGSADGVEVIGTTGGDTIAVGQSGVGLNADTDADITFSPLPTRIVVRGVGGLDTLSGRGGQGAGALFAGELLLAGGDAADTLRGGLGNDELRGGADNDLLEGREGADELYGDDENDNLAGGDGDDQLTGGAGADSFAGSSGNDVFFATDGAADTQLSGGPGTDTAHYDAVLDPAPLAVENRIPE